MGLRDRLKRIKRGRDHCGMVENATKFGASMAQGIAATDPWHPCYRERPIRVLVHLDNAPLTDEYDDKGRYLDTIRSAFIEVRNVCVMDLIIDQSNDPPPNGPDIVVDFRYIGRNILGQASVGGSCHGIARWHIGTQWEWTRQDFFDQCLHEIGHLLGLGHDQCENAGGEANVMCWQTRSDFDGYDSRTAGYLREIYGPPSVDPPEPPEPPDDPRKVSRATLLFDDGDTQVLTSRHEG